MALYLQGESLPHPGPISRSIVPLARAAQGSPDDIHIWLALGWCHKRTGRIDLAIESLEEALTLEPDDALIHYNLACYSAAMAGDKRHTLSYLSKARSNLKDDWSLVVDEPDFDSIRSDPGFGSRPRDRLASSKVSRRAP